MMTIYPDQVGTTMLLADKFSFPMPAPDGSVFAADCFESIVDTVSAMQTVAGEWVEVHILDAEVAEDGSSVRFTIECPAGVALLVDTLQVSMT